MKKIKLSIIIATYNRPEALRLVLLALNAQSDKDFEVIVGDDGSTKETQQLITTLQKQVDYHITHVWQEDTGFRLATIRNKAVAHSAGNYLVFLDDDCPMPPWFVAQHKKLAEKNYYIVGNRILLSQAYTQQVTNKQLAIWHLPRVDWLLNRFKHNCNRFLPLIILPLGFVRKLHPKKWRGLRGCNLALWKQDLIRVNGFNEAFTGWGYEDSDFIIRLMRTGVKRKEGRFAVPVFHLWHKENDRSNERKNYQALQTVLHNNIVKAQQGIDQYL
jgi:glycosyltransferase involved in cell wall biosynthesis